MIHVIPEGIETCEEKELKMKKYWSFGLILILVFCLAACTGSKETTPEPDAEPVETTDTPTTPAPTQEPAEELIPPEPVEMPAMPEEKDTVLGSWYGLLEGGMIRLDLTDDMKYAVHFLNGEKADHEGTWTIADGLVTLDGEDKPTFSLTMDGESLYWHDAETVLSREEPGLYAPSELLKELDKDAFDGYWKSAYVALNGLVVPSELVGDSTDVYIEGTKAALGGPLFGDVVVTLEKDGNALVAKGGDGAEARFEMQEDLVIRLTLQSGADEPLVLYLFSEPYGKE